jgi:hypothetical protein
VVAMNLRTQKRLLVALNAVLAAGVLASAGPLLLPLEVEAPVARKDVTRQAATGPAAKTTPLSDFAVIHARDLKKPLFDVVATAAPPPDVPKPQLTVTLVGTAVEPGFTYGLFRLKSGEVKIVERGQTIEGAEVTEVSEDSATVRFHGELITLKAERKGPAP